MNRRETLETERELIEPLIDDGEDWEASSDHSKNYSFDRLPRRSRLPFEKSPTKVALSWFVATLFLALLTCRLVTLVLKAVHEINCFVRGKKHSLQCSNSTLISFNLENTTGWLCASVITSTICLIALPTIPEFRGYKYTLSKFIRRSYFYGINIMLVSVLVYHALLMTIHEVPINKAIAGLFMSEKVLAAFTVFAFNFLRPPARHDSYPALRVMYHAAVISALIENAYLFFYVSLDTTFKISAKEKFSNLSDTMNTFMVMLLAIEATFRLTLVNFFWKKLFYGGKDIYSDMKYLDDI